MPNTLEDGATFIYSTNIYWAPTVCYLLEYLLYTQEFL